MGLGVGNGRRQSALKAFLPQELAPSQVAGGVVSLRLVLGRLA